MASQIQKLAYVDNKLGAPSSGQQTTRIIFNTIEAPGVTSSLVFFRSFQGLTNGQTNLNQNKLDSMESMVIKTIWLAQFDAAGALSAFASTEAATLSIIVGNQTVIKNLPLQFNAGLTGQAFDRLHENAGATINRTLAETPTYQRFMPTEIRLLTDIVIPPQVAFEVRVDGTNVQFGAGASVCALAGYGKIFSAGNTF